MFLIFMFELIISFITFIKQNRGFQTGVRGPPGGRKGILVGLWKTVKKNK